MNTKISFQGKEYNSFEELPPEAKKAFEKLNKVLGDKDQNGVPDIFEGKAGFMETFKNIYNNSQNSTSIDINSTDTSIQNSSKLDIFNSSTSPYKNPLHEKIANSSTQSTLLFFVGVFFTALILLGAFLFFHFKG